MAGPTTPPAMGAKTSPVVSPQARRDAPLKALALSSEVFPLVKTGGLADVAGALPLALARENVAMRTLLPGYPAVMSKIEGAQLVHAYAEFYGGPTRILRARAGALELYVLDAPHLYDRPGQIYLGPDGADWPDNALRFAAFARAGADLAHGLDKAFAPDVVHAHDWQAGLVAAFLRFDGGPRPGIVATIHNLAFQGRYPREMLAQLGLPEAAFALDGVEYYGGVGFLKAGLHFADRVTTVSPTYAQEIRTPEFGMGLDGLLRARGDRVFGVLNGIDVDVWNPATDPLLPAGFDAKNLAGRAVCRKALQQTLRLAPDPDALIVGVVSRLSWQKGLDLLPGCTGLLERENIQLAMLGAGDADLENDFRALASEYAGRVGLRVGYDEALAHLVQAGSDTILVPSRFEPCGLTQLCALRYGAIPVVARVGGLADTVIDANEMALGAGVATGLQFAPGSAERLADALTKAARLKREPAAWAKMQANGMATDVSWRRPAAAYADIYRQAIVDARGLKDA
jgi:starch synthase